MCRSTARTVMNKRPAIAALFAPVAIWATTSRSRGLRLCKPVSAMRDRAVNIASTMRGSITDPP
jgi:hypothetical protein